MLCSWSPSLCALNNVSSLHHVTYKGCNTLRECRIHAVLHCRSTYCSSLFPPFLPHPFKPAALTGESETVLKDTTVVPDVDAEVQALHNMLFASTGVTAGRAQAVVVATGMNTELGEIHKSVTSADESSSTPLQLKMDEFGEILQVWPVQHWNGRSALGKPSDAIPIPLQKIILYVCIGVWFLHMGRFIFYASHEGESYFSKALLYLKVRHCRCPYAAAALTRSPVVMFADRCGTGRCRHSRGPSRRHHRLPSPWHKKNGKTQCNCKQQWTPPYAWR